MCKLHNLDTIFIIINTLGTNSINQLILNWNYLQQHNTSELICTNIYNLRKKSV